VAPFWVDPTHRCLIECDDWLAAPDGPPLDLLVRQVNSSSAIVKWSEPVSGQRNGIITSYQVRKSKLSNPISSRTSPLLWTPFFRSKNVHHFS